MRLLQRKLRSVRIAARLTGNDVEAFSAETRSVRARLIPVAAGLESRPFGLGETETLNLLLPAGCGIQAGDGVCIDLEVPEWRCVSVQEWTNHISAKLERIAGQGR